MPMIFDANFRNLQIAGATRNLDAVIVTFFWKVQFQPYCIVPRLRSQHSCLRTKVLLHPITYSFLIYGRSGPLKFFEVYAQQTIN